MTTPEERRATVAAWQRRRRRLIGYGQWQPFVDAAPARTHVEAIRDTGMSLKNIADCAGTGSLDFLIYGDPPIPPAKRIRPETADALLNYWPTLDDYHDGSLIDATGTTRRLQALTATGWTTPAVHQHINFVNPKSLEPTRSNKQVTARLARAVRDLYTWASIGQGEDHGITPWVAERNRRRAERLGWASPAYWDDDTIDDPAFTPATVTRIGKREEAEIVAEEIRHLASFGISTHEIARRVNRAEPYIREQLAGRRGPGWRQHLEEAA